MAETDEPRRPLTAADKRKIVRDRRERARERFELEQRLRELDGHIPGFDVVVEKVIGHVTIGQGGKNSPVEAAFLHIANYVQEFEHPDEIGGTFRFAAGNSSQSGQIVVTVALENALDLERDSRTDEVA